MTKVVIIDGQGQILARLERYTGAEHRKLANKAMEEVLKQAALSFEEITYIVATGYGRLNVPFADRQITELSCHTRGLVSLFPSVRTAIDIGGQDSKGMRIVNGKLVDFVMNDRCAAGTGRFLEITAETLGLKAAELGDISAKAANKTSISSVCTIFAQQEIVSLISEGAHLQDIVAGLHSAIASRVVRMASRLKIEPDVVFTGGVARNTGVVKAIEETLGCKVYVPDDPLISGALGAAILAQETVKKAEARGETPQRKERRLEEVTFFK